MRKLIREWMKMSNEKLTVERKTSAAFIVDSKYITDRVAVVETNAAAEPWFADPTGQTDSTEAIQKAIDFCADTLGGGAVYLPAGRYRVEGSITVKNATTLLGDYVDPDKVTGTDYGTMLLVYSDKRFADAVPAVKLCGHAAVDGITFYYPEQNVDNPIDYYYTFASPTEGFRTIRNVTLLNSYCGITSPLVGATGLNTIDNVKGTVLKEGLYVYNDADISYYRNMHFTPDYWAQMDGSFSPPSCDAVREAMKAIESIGIRVQNTDRDCFRNVVLDGFRYGFYSEKPCRSAWNGSLYNVTVNNAEYGVYAEGVCGAYGTNIAESKISGSKYALCNRSENHSDVKALNLYNVELEGECEGSIINLTGEKMACDDYSRITPLPSNGTLYNAVRDYGADNTSETDSTAAIQKALDEAGEKGGGTVYLPAGKYLLEGTLTVHAGTLLQGSCHYANGHTTMGTILFAYSKEKELITVEGQSAGISGISVVYPDNCVTDTEYTKHPDKNIPYTIRCVGKNTYVKNVSLSCTSNGILFEDSDDFIIDRIFMTVWHNGVKIVNSNRGYIYGIHTNVGLTGYYTTDSRCSHWIKGGKHFGEHLLPRAYVMIDHTICHTLTLFRFENSKDIQLIENFHYGALNYALLDASSLYFENAEGSRILKGGVLFGLTGSSEVRGVNLIGYGHCPPFNIEEGSRITIGNVDIACKPNYNYGI